VGRAAAAIPSPGPAVTGASPRAQGKKFNTGCPLAAILFEPPNFGCWPDT